MGNDYISITEGAGKNMSTDRISGIDYQRFKLIHGESGSNDGDIARSNPYPVREGQAEDVLALTTLVYSSITGTYADLSLGTIDDYTLIEVWNDTDGLYLLSWDEGTTDHHIIPPYSARTLKIKAGATSLYIKYSSAPTAGNLYFEVIK